MSNRASYEKEIFNAIDILRSYGFNDQQALIDILCRVTRTKKLWQSLRQIPTPCIALCRK